MLAFAMDSFDLDASNCDNGIVANKNRKREVDFFCKEIVKLGGDGRETECAVLVSQALYVIGAALLKASVEYPEIFQHMNKLLACGLETATKESHEIPGWEKMIRDERKLYRIADACTTEDLTLHEQRFRVVQGKCRMTRALPLLFALTPVCYRRCGSFEFAPPTRPYKPALCFDDGGASCQINARNRSSKGGVLVSHQYWTGRMLCCGRRHCHLRRRPQHRN